MEALDMYIYARGLKTFPHLSFYCLTWAPPLPQLANKVCLPSCLNGLPSCLNVGFVMGTATARAAMFYVCIELNYSHSLAKRMCCIRSLVWSLANCMQNIDGWWVKGES